MNEIVIISGKGGTGKTSVAASLAVLAENAVIADCDVDAADLHLVLSPQVEERHEFYAGHEAIIDRNQCCGCGACLAHCRFGAVRMEGARAGEAAFWIDPIACEGCGVCVRFCPVQAITFPERRCGEWMISKTRVGPMVHARLGIASENSGKLVSIVRREARRIAQLESHSLILVDGPPGIGCPVIASVTGATLAVVVTEPTISGEHDLDRVLSLTRHFRIPTAICINKWDLNPDMTRRMEEKAQAAKVHIGGRIRYNCSVTEAQLHAKAAVEYDDAEVSNDLRKVWANICAVLSSFREPARQCPGGLAAEEYSCDR